MSIAITPNLRAARTAPCATPRELKPNDYDEGSLLGESPTVSELGQAPIGTQSTPRVCRPRIDEHHRGRDASVNEAACHETCPTANSAIIAGAPASVTPPEDAKAGASRSRTVQLTINGDEANV